MSDIIPPILPHALLRHRRCTMISRVTIGQCSSIDSSLCSSPYSRNIIRQLLTRLSNSYLYNFTIRMFSPLENLTGSFSIYSNTTSRSRKWPRIASTSTLSVFMFSASVPIPFMHSR